MEWLNENWVPLAALLLIVIGVFADYIATVILLAFCLRELRRMNRDKE